MPNKPRRVRSRTARSSASAAATARGAVPAATPSAAAQAAQAQRMPTIRRVTTPRDTNVMGTVFGGAILSEIDLAAAIQAHRLHPGNVVTVAMDKVEFHRPVFVGDLLSLYTEVVRTGRTSITVRVCVWAERRRPPFESVPVTEALVTMVAVNEHMEPVPVSAVSKPP
jgi:acyl-CoA thioesterase YciA